MRECWTGFPAFLYRVPAWFAAAWRGGVDARTVQMVAILVATAEPWGTYHSRFVGPPLASLGVDVAHLVPTFAGVSPVPVPGVRVKEGLDAVASARLLVVGSLSPGSWPADAATVAVAAGVPVLFSHFAYLGSSFPPAVTIPMVGVTAASPSDAVDVAAHLGWSDVAGVRVVGTPALDAVQLYRPVARSLLVVSSVSRELGEPGRLPAAARIAADAGWDVSVSLHPREDPDVWSAFRIVTVSPVVAAASASVAFGYPGSVFPTVAATGVPLVALADPVIDVFVPDGIRRLASRCETPGGIVGALHVAEPASLGDVAWAAGPYPGATARLVDAWLAACS